MALTVRNSPALLGMLALAFNELREEFVASSTTFAHFDITSDTTGDTFHGTPTITPIAVVGGTANLAAVAATAESARAVLLRHLGDDIAHRVADTVNADGISYAALPPLLATTADVPATFTGTSATYSAVTADHTLTLAIDGTRYIVTFAGTENSQALFHSAVNAALPMGTNGLRVGYVRNASGETMLVANPQSGRPPTGSVVAGNSDVLASLGLAVGDTLVLVAAVTATQGAVDTLLEALAASETAHFAQSGVHATDDSTNALTSSAATDLASSKLRAADIKTVTNAHILFGPTSPSLNVVPG